MAQISPLNYKAIQNGPLNIGLTDFGSNRFLNVKAMALKCGRAQWIKLYDL